jgi:hypothetical protein
VAGCGALILGMAANVQAQISPKRILGTFIVRDSGAFNYEFTRDAKDSYLFNITSVSVQAKDRDSSQPSGLTETDLLKQKDPKKEPVSDPLVFSTFSKDVFRGLFNQKMLKDFKIKEDLIRDQSLEVYLEIERKLNLDEPITAYFILKRDYVNSFLHYNASKYYKGSLSWPYTRHYIERVEAETDDGALKNVSVYMADPNDVRNGKLTPREPLIFKNQFPISMSGKFDYEKFSSIKLYCFNCEGIEGLSRYINLMDFGVFDIVYEPNKEDYSPQNMKFFATPSHPIVELRKEQRARLLEVAAFTDFVGLDRNEPNGLLQFEARRRINLNTKYRLLVRGDGRKFTDFNLGAVEFKQRPIVTGATRKQVKKAQRTLRYLVYPKDSMSKHYIDSMAKKIGSAELAMLMEKGKYPPNFNSLDSIRWELAMKAKTPIDSIDISTRKFRSPYLNFFGYVEPKVLFAKLDQTNRYVDSAKAVSGQIDPIDLYRYQLATFGFNLQVFRVSFPQIKLQWNMINAGVFWTRTRVALTIDSTGPTKALNSNFWQFGSNLVFRPDHRWGASMGFEYILPRIWDNEYAVVNRKGLFQQQFDAWYKTGDEAKLFFRFRWTYQNGDRTKNFTQAQLGYSVNLFTGENDKDKISKQ